MATIDGQPLPDFLVTEFRRIIDSVRPSALLSFLKVRPDLIKGFRPNRTHITPLRKRLTNLFLESGELDEGVRSFLAEESLNLAFIVVLSESVLRYLFREFWQVYGDAFCAALLLDERVAVRQIFFDQRSLWENGPQEKDRGAVDKLGHELGPFLGHIKRLQENDEDLGHQDGSSLQLAECQKKLARLEKELVESRKPNKEKKALKKLGDKKEALEKECATLQEKWAREKKRHQQVVKEKKALEQRLEKLQENIEKQVKQEKERELTSLVRSWLREPLALENEALGQQTSDDVLAQAQDLLLRQRAIDRNLGNRKILADRIHALCEVRRELVESAQNSLNPLPDLDRIHGQLDTEIERLERVLGRLPENPLLAKIATKIGSVRSEAERANVAHLLEVCEDNGLFGVADMKELYRRYDRKVGALYDQFSFKKDDRHADDPVETLKRMLHVRGELHLLVDGYNVLHGLVELLGLEGREVTDETARKRLLELVDQLVAGSQSEATLFFDGPREQARSYSAHVKEVYSGGGGAENRNRADKAIVTYIKVMQAKNRKRPFYVVTDDKELQAYARKAGGRIVPLARFAALLDELSR